MDITIKEEIVFPLESRKVFARTQSIRTCPRMPRL